MAADRVYLEHPKLPGQGIRVRKTAVAAHRASGWQPADEPPQPAEPEPEPESGPEPETAVPPRRRRAPKSEGEE